MMLSIFTVVQPSLQFNFIKFLVQKKKKILEIHGYSLVPIANNIVYLKFARRRGGGARSY